MRLGHWIARVVGLLAIGWATLGAPPARAVDTITVGTVGSPSANLWPVFIGIDKGFFTAENVKLDLIYIPSSASVIQQLSAGSLDMTMSTGIVDPIRAIDQGAAVALTRFEVQVPPYALLAKSAIKSQSARPVEKRTITVRIPRRHIRALGLPSG